MRIISISDYYHFAFLIVSIALLGFGISGSFLYFFIQRIRNKNLILVIFAFSFAVSIYISYIMINIIPFDSFKIAWELKQIFYLFFYYFFLLLPFFFGGSFIGYVFYEEGKPQITYFYNLIGSAAGAIGFLLLVKPAGKTGVLIISVAFGIVATFLLITKRILKLFIIMSLIFIILIVAIFLYFPSALKVRMSPYKSLPTLLRVPGSRVIYSRENASTRIDIIESESIKSIPGLSLKYQDVPPPQIGMTEDGDNLTPITRINDGFSVQELDFFRYTPLSVIFSADPDLSKATEKSDILIIEPGGGMDIQGSLYLGGLNNDITVVQDNSLMIDALIKYNSYSGNIYSMDNVRLIHSSSRNFCNTTKKRFDLVLISLSDSYHPVSSGAYSLNENYIYTVQSFKELIEITENDGILVINRWLQAPPSESLKAISTLVESLGQSGIKDITEKLFVFRSWSTVTVIFKKNGFSTGTLESLKDELSMLNYDLIYCDGVKEQQTNLYNIVESNKYFNYFKKIIEKSRADRIEIKDNYYFNIEPATDNKPYFFNFFKLIQTPDIIKYFGKSTQPFGGGGYLVLVISLLISIFLSLVLIIVPLKIRKISLNIRSDYKFLLYFIALGFGFFFIELPLIQKFILILGNPAYSVSLILFAIMLSAGLGSFTISRLRIDIKWVVLFLVLYIVVFIFLSGYIQEFIMTKLLWQRFIYSTLLIIPLGFFMGMPFPLGLSKAKNKKQVIVPWLWAVNGCCSVIGSISAVIISIHLGFLVVMGIAALLYISAFFAYRHF